MALDDTQVGDTLDYLGRTQPLASQRLTTLPTNSAGGGAVAPPITGGGPLGTQSQFGQPSTPFDAPGLSPLAKAIAALQGGSKVANFASRIFDFSGADLGARGDTGGLSLSDEVRSFQQAGERIPFADSLDPAAAAGADFGGGVAAEAGSNIGSVIGEALPYVGATIPLITSFARGGPQTDRAAAFLAVDTAAAAAAPFTFGASQAASGIARGIDGLLTRGFDLQTILDFGGLGMLTSLFGNEGSYVPKRQGAQKAASESLSNLGAVYQTAAQSGDPEQILQALATGEGERGAVRSWLKIPNELAVQLFGDQSSVPNFGNYGDRTQVEWANLDAAGFGKLVSALQADPDLIGSTVMGSGDVGYLPQEQAEQVAGVAAQNAQALLSFLVGQRGDQGGGPAQPTGGPDVGMPVAVVPQGPDAALGFATDRLNA